MANRRREPKGTPHGGRFATEWSAGFGADDLDPDDYSMWDAGQPAERILAHRWADAHIDLGAASTVRVVANRNNGCPQLVSGTGQVATFDVDGYGRPTVAWYGVVPSEHLEQARMGELDDRWWRGPDEPAPKLERWSTDGSVDISDRDGHADGVWDDSFLADTYWGGPSDWNVDGMPAPYAGAIALMDGHDPMSDVQSASDYVFTRALHGYEPNADEYMDNALLAVRRQGSFPPSMERKWAERLNTAFDEAVRAEEERR